MELLRPIPAVALIPVVMLIFGLGYSMEIALVAFTTIWPVLLLTVAAVRGVKPRLIEVSRLLGMGRLERMVKIVIRAALPGIFVGFRLSLAASLVIAVTVEIVANPIGLGQAMMQAEESLHPALMLAYLVWVGLVGLALNGAVLYLQRRWFGAAASARPA
jgi:NitT/TauT family transport system permease protein